MMLNSSTVILMRRQVQGNTIKWVEHVNKAVLDYNEGHVVIREPDTRILLADFPKWIIHTVERVNNTTIKLNLKNNNPNSSSSSSTSSDFDQIAMRFQNTNDVDDYVKAALSFGINCSNPDFIPAIDTTSNSNNDISTFLRNINQGLEFPDIRETHAQQFCLSLLINPKFNDLVEDIEELLTKFKERF